MRQNYNGVGESSAPPQLELNATAGLQQTLYNLMPMESGSGGTSSNSGGQYSNNSVGDNRNAQNAGASHENNDQPNNKCHRPPFTMHGVLHYLQHEWSRYELERAQWEMERAELRARISFLVGERNGQECLKRDLVRRIKMLEYSLKQERAKLHRLMNDGQDPIEEDSDDCNSGNNSNVPMDIDLGEKNNINSQTWKEARQILRQYLQEIGYSEKILDVRSFRVKNLLGLMPDNNLNMTTEGRKAAEKALIESEQAILDTADIIKQSRRHNVNKNEAGGSNNADNYVGDDDSDSDNDEKNNLDVEAVKALEEFSFLQCENVAPTQKNNTAQSSGDFNECNDQNSHLQKRKSSGKVRWNNLDQNETYQRKENDFCNRTEDRQNYEQINDDDCERISKRIRDVFCPIYGKGKGEVDGFNTLNDEQERSRRGRLMNLIVNSALVLQSANDDIDIKDNFAMANDDSLSASQHRWNICYTLRSHFDAIRAMQFHPVHPVLISASEDGTAKVWDLSNAFVNKLSDNKSVHQNIQPTTGIIDVEPFFTFRGHKGPILAMDLSPTGEMCYTGGYDGKICSWVVPSLQVEVYNNYDPSVLQTCLVGHTDCIWALAFHSSTNRLISASADGTIRVWEAEVAEGMQSLVKTFVPPQLDSGLVLRPRSIDIVSTEPQQLLTAYSKTQCSILDLETGQNVLSFDFNEDSNEVVGEINKILSHPTMPVTVVAGEDRKIRFFDNNTGKLIDTVVAHVEGISTLAIDPNGLYLLSGSHDGSLRLWNMEKRTCLQEIATHRKKYDMSVMAVAFHPSRSLIASAGADSLAKVFTMTNDSSIISNNYSLSAQFPTTTSGSTTTASQLMHCLPKSLQQSSSLLPLAPKSTSISLAVATTTTMTSSSGDLTSPNFRKKTDG